MLRYAKASIFILFRSVCFLHSMLIIHSGSIVYALGRVLYMQNTSRELCALCIVQLFNLVALLKFFFHFLFHVRVPAKYRAFTFFFGLRSPRFLSMLSTNNLCEFVEISVSYVYSQSWAQFICDANAQTNDEPQLQPLCSITQHIRS